MIKFTELKEVKEAIEEYIEKTTLEKFIMNCSRGFGKTEIKNYIMLKLIEKEEKNKEVLQYE